MMSILTITASGGSNNGTITAVYDATTSTSSRVATVTVSGSGVTTNCNCYPGRCLVTNISLTSLSVSSKKARYFQHSIKYKLDLSVLKQLLLACNTGPEMQQLL
jgi:hypothetical protein